MNETTKNFWAALTAPEPETLPVRWYLAYNAAGKPTEVTSETPNGKYIEIDAETASRNPSMTRGWLVVDGVLSYTPPNNTLITATRRKYMPPKDIAFGDYNMLILKNADRDQ